VTVVSLMIYKDGGRRRERNNRRTLIEYLLQTRMLSIEKRKKKMLNARFFHTKTELNAWLVQYNDMLKPVVS
jgi:hypothetical protein